MYTDGSGNGVRASARDEDGMGGKKILLVDDDPNILDVVRVYLVQEGFDVLTATDGEAALAAAARHQPDLIILDLQLPRLGGLDVMRSLQSGNNVPVIILTARGQETDRVVGLELGADDYVAKPFSPRELMARLKAVLRRAQQSPSGERAEPLTIGALSVDPLARRVTKAGQELALTAKEFDLLWFFVRHANQVFTRDQLIQHVWGYDFFGEASTVTVHIRRLREKIEPDPSHPRHLQTVWGVGYRFEVEG